MSNVPDVSVVIAGHNGAGKLGPAIESVLSQDGVRLELVVVDDGSTDGSWTILEGYAERDPRIRIVRQQHAGQTKALIRGCALARGTYIAREDVGDVSLPGRLQRQYECLEARTDAVFVSCGTRFVGPSSEHLYDALSDEAEVAAALRSPDSSELRGPAHHGSVMFRRAAYEKVGGYRPEFYFAQDLDLWVRLAEVGEHAVVREILYQALASPGSLSAMHRREQVALTKLIAQSARRRRHGRSDLDVLTRAAAIRPSASSRPGRVARARALYFIGACLGRRRDAAATGYFLQAIRQNPLHFKAWMRLLSGR